jgi:DNA (cytosine-5)-methyltransferase 1
VFVVGCLGDWERAAQVLFERESVQRDSSSRRTEGQGASANAEVGVGAGRWWDGTDCAGTLTKQNAGGGQRMPDKDNLGAVLQPIGYRWQNNRDGLQQDDAVAALRASSGNSGFHEMNHPVVAVGFNWQNGGGYGNANDGLGITVEGTGPLQRCNTPAVAFTRCDNGQDAAVDHTPTMRCGSNYSAHLAVAFQQNQLGEVRCGNIAGTVNTNSNASGRNTPMAMQAMTVRRLTPIECEFLQGFSRNYTLIPWRKKQAEDCPDGPRYKALGNSMAVNCMAWIGERIAALENNR